MPIPVVTCSADVVLSYAVPSRLVQLNATATLSPTSWLWTILSVPEGSTADVGVKGDFTDGVAIIQNPQLLIDGVVTGGYTIQCVATNVDGPSDPDIDRCAGQQLIIVRTQSIALWLPGDWAYDWGKRYLDKTLRALEAAIETILGSNVGTGGVGVFKQKSGATLQFKNIAPGSAKVTVTDDAGNNEVDVDVVPAQINHQDLNDVGGYDHGDIDAHVSSTSNPHSVTGTQVGLGNVTDDAQLTREPGDFDTFAPKAAPADADVALLEDSADGLAKKKTTVAALRGFPVTDKGDLFTFDTAAQKLPVGASGQVLTVDLLEATGLRWQDQQDVYVPWEEEFATTGAEDPGDIVAFHLSRVPIGAGVANTPSGYDLGVYRLGVRMKYVAGAPGAVGEYTFDPVTTDVSVYASGDADGYVVCYAEAALPGSYSFGSETFGTGTFAG